MGRNLQNNGQKRTENIRPRSTKRNSHNPENQIDDF
jgi:hypothetical protein